MRQIHAVAALALLAAAAATGAAAQPKPEGRAAIVQGLVDCRKLTEDAARLACYDKAATALDQAEARGDVVVVDREQARAVRRQAFGFALPSLSMFEKGEAREDLDNVAGKIASTRKDGSGKWILRLEDGATWAQIDVTELTLDPKPGQSVKIRKATLGSYLVSVEGRRAFRGRRVE